MTRYEQYRLQRAIHKLWLKVSADKPKTERINMPNDPLAEIATISAAYSALATEVQTLLAAQTNATDTVSPDVQASLDKLAAPVAQPVTAPTPAPSAS